jgi:phage terminase large subunit-like protein
VVVVMAAKVSKLKKPNKKKFVLPDDPVTQYAKKVMNGKIIACEATKNACKRHIKDLKRQGTKSFPYVFNQERAERLFRFFSYLKHVEGEVAGRPIKLVDFQQFIVGSIFGWVHKETGFRRFKKAYIQVARKNTKSELSGGISDYMAGFDGEMGAQVYATATKKDQAKIVWNFAKKMIKGSPDLKKRFRIRESTLEIFHDKTDSIIRPLGKDTDTIDGFNPHLGNIDEYHAHKTTEMYDVLISGMGLQTQGLLLIITTAGFLLNGPCHKEYNYCKKILSGILENDEYFVYIAELDEGDDIKNPKNWYKANPLMHHVPRMKNYLKGELKAALEDPDKMRNFMTKNMNLFVDFKANGYMDMKKWDACGVDIMPDMTGKECYIGYDLSAKIDLTSVDFEFPIELTTKEGEIVPGYAVFSHSFMPEETVERKRKTDKVPYDMWIREGWITVTPGAVVDYRFVKKYALERAKENGWIINEHCLDPWGAVQISSDLIDEGETAVEVVQGIKTLSEPTKDFRDQVYLKRVIHEKNPVLRWAMSNAVTREDHNKNFMLDKQKSTERIDPCAAVMNSHVRAMVNEDTRSVYEERGILSI